MSNSNYSIGLQCLKPVQTAYGAICMPIRKLLMHWHHSSTSQLCIYVMVLSNVLVLGTRRKWPRPSWDRDVDNFSREETETRRSYVSRPSRDRDVETETTTLANCIMYYMDLNVSRWLRPTLNHLILLLLDS